MRLSNRLASSCLSRCPLQILLKGLKSETIYFIFFHGIIASPDVEYRLGEHPFILVGNICKPLAAIGELLSVHSTEVHCVVFSPLVMQVKVLQKKKKKSAW